MLESRARQYTLPYRYMVRAKMILLAAECLSNKEIAERLDSWREVVSKWRKRFYQRGVAGLDERPFRPRIHPPRDLRLPRHLGCPPGPALRPCGSPLHSEEFDRLGGQVMATEPYASAARVFWIVDNPGIHRGHASIDRLEGRWENLKLIHLPVHASWPNQIEIYFSVLQRKVLTPDDVAAFEAARARILGLQEHYQQIAHPYNWKFTRDDLTNLMVGLESRAGTMAIAA